MNQHESRKVAMQAIFLADQNPELTAAEVEEKISSTLALKQLSAYSKTLIEGTLAKRDQLDELISAHLKKDGVLTGLMLLRLQFLNLLCMKLNIVLKFNQKQRLMKH